MSERERMSRRAEELADQVRRGLRTEDGALSALASYSEALTGKDDIMAGDYSEAWKLYDYGVKQFKQPPPKGGSENG